jgi:Mrp family chromosome partitioning ATPase
VLAARRVREVLDWLAERHDVVVIDSPPLLAVSDAIPLFSVVDGVIIVARLGVTTRDASRRLTNALERIPQGNVVGVVANDQSGSMLETPYYEYYRTKSE